MESEIRTYKEICKDLLNATPKEARKLHKELKTYGTGVCFLDRYPYFPAIIHAIAIAISVVALIVSCTK